MKNISSFRGFMLFLAVSTIVFGQTSNAVAAGSSNGRNYVGQYTAYASGLSYYGWAGVKGNVHVKTNATLAGSSGNRFTASYLGMSSPNSRWVQSGVTRDDLYSAPYLFAENVYGWTPQGQAIRTYEEFDYFIAPATFWRAIYYSRYDMNSGYHMWNCELGGGAYRIYKMDTSYGRAQGMTEVLNNGGWSNPGQVYWGTNQAGWNGAAYQLTLKGAGGWERWDTSLTGQSTRIDDTYSPPYYYSHGYDHYYFGTWIRW